MPNMAKYAFLAHIWVSIGRYWLIHDGALTFIRLPQLKETIETREERVTRDTEA